MYMKPIFLLATIALISLVFFRVSPGQTIKLEKELSLPADVNLSLIEHVDISDNGDVLITDNSRRNVILFNKEEEAFLELNPEGCHPGYSFQPVRSYFVDDEIWVMNVQSSLFRFKSDGSCIGADSKRFSVPDHFSVADSKRVAAIRPAGYNLRNPGLTLYDRDLSEVSKQISFKNQITAPEMGFRFGGGGLFSHNGKIYFSLSSAPIIYIYSIEAGKLMEVSAGDTFDLKVSNGNSRGNPASIIGEVQDYIRNYSTTIDLRKLNDNTAVLFARHSGRSSRELLFFDLNSNTFLQDTYVIDGKSDEYYRVFANSKAYNVYFDEEKDGWVLQVFDVQVSK